MHFFSYIILDSLDNSSVYTFIGLVCLYTIYIIYFVEKYLFEKSVYICNSVCFGTSLDTLQNIQNSQGTDVWRRLFLKRNKQGMVVWGRLFKKN